MSSPVQSRRERERDQRRADILEAAGRVFAERGFSEATMDDVAAAAELSKGTLYLYFRNKDALFLSLSDLVLDDVLAAVDAIRASASTGLDKVRAILAAYAATQSQNGEKFRVSVQRLASNATMDLESPAFAGHRERVGRIVGAFVASIEEGQRDGSILSQLDPHATATELWGGILGVVLVSINFEELNRRFPQPINRDRLIPDFIATVTRGIAAEPAAPPHAT